MNFQIKDSETINRLSLLYLKKYHEPPFLRLIPTGGTLFAPDVTTYDVELALQRCLDENIRLCEIYPELNDDGVNHNDDDIC